MQQLLFPSLLTPLAVALSGGADSMALTLLADQWARENGATLIALTVDHGLREESRAEAEQVAAWMRTRGIAHYILTPPHTNDSNNLQENARQRRYDALADFCRAHNILHCLIAHHAGDVRETIALHTARGETADGAVGITAVRNYRGVRFVRPMLQIERPALEVFLRTHAATWIHDPSNENSNFARVRMRQQLAEDKDLCAALDATADRESVARTARDEALAEAAMRIVTLHPLGYAELPLAAWQALEPTLASQLLADCLTTIGGHIHRPRRHETARLYEALSASGFRKRTLHSCEITLRRGVLRIARELSRVEAPVQLSSRGECVWDQRFHVRYDVVQPLTLRALGADGKKQLTTHHSLLTTHYSPPLSSPSLWHLDALLFVPHMEGSPRAPSGIQVTIGFAPPKPLAAAPFWCLNNNDT